MAGVSASVLGRILVMDSQKVIMESYSECHWPGGQLRVSTLNLMVESNFCHPKDKSWSSFDSPVAVLKHARFSISLWLTSAHAVMVASLSVSVFTTPLQRPTKKASALRRIV